MPTDPELCYLIANVCKPPKNYFDFPEIAQFFRFGWFEEFPWAYYSRWEDRTNYLPCILFGYKNVGKSLQKVISNMGNSCKNIKKHQNVPRGTHRKRQILGEHTLFQEKDHFHCRC